MRAGLLDPQDRFFCPTLLSDTSFAYLTSRRQDDGRWQLGAHGLGPDGQALAENLVNLLPAWHRLHTAGVRPQITVHPAGTLLPDTDRLRLLVPRQHTVTAITWPDGDR